MWRRTRSCLSISVCVCAYFWSHTGLCIYKLINSPAPRLVGKVLLLFKYILKKNPSPFRIFFACAALERKQRCLISSTARRNIFTVKDRKGREKTVPCIEYVDVVKRQREFYTFPLFLMKSSWFFLFILLLPSTRILPPSYMHITIERDSFLSFFLMVRNIQELKRTNDKILHFWHVVVWFFCWFI